MPYQAKITSKGQISIPKELRERFQLREGEEVLLIPGDEVIILKPGLNPMRRLRGVLREEVDLNKASEFIRKTRREWRVDPA